MVITENVFISMRYVRVASNDVHLLCKSLRIRQWNFSRWGFRRNCFEELAVSKYTTLNNVIARKLPWY